MNKRLRFPSKTSLKQKIGLIFFGVFLSLVLLEIGLHAGGFIYSSRQEFRNISFDNNKKTYRILCIGESTTAWKGVNSYPRQLENILNERNNGTVYQVINKGVSSTNTSAILRNIEAYLNKYKPDMVISMMGLNDEDEMEKYINISQNSFLNSLKIFKLMKYIKFHILSKLEESNSLDGKSISLEYLKNFTREGFLKKRIEANPRDTNGYDELAAFYRHQGNYSKAEMVYKRGIEMNPEKSVTYLELGDLYAALDRFKEAEKVLNTAIAINPKEYQAYIDLGETFKFRKDFDKSKEIFLKAIKVNPKRYLAEQLLGCLYWDLGEYDKAEVMLFQAIEKKTKFNDENAEFLKVCNWNQGELNRAEKILEKAIEKDPKNYLMYSILASIYQKRGYTDLANKNYEKADIIRSNFANPVTKANYNKLKAILDDRKIKLVSVQYPMRSVEPLKKIFTNTEGILFVDNKDVFIKAVNEGGYEKYFEDMIGGDFGHCTIEGCRLLAENVADTLLKEK